MKISIYKTLLFFVCMVYSFEAHSQNKIDSLENELKKFKEKKLVMANNAPETNDTLMANILYKLSSAFWGNDLDMAMDYAKQTLVLSEKIGFKKGIGNAYNSMGVINNFKGDYLSALEFFKKSLRIREEIGDQQSIAGTYNNIGSIYLDQGNYQEALKQFFAALKINEQTGNKLWRSINLTNIGSVYKNQENYPEALENYFAALKIQEEIGDKSGSANTYVYIGNIYINQENTFEAIKNYSSALKIHEEVGNKRGIASYYGNMANIYDIQRNYPSAMKHYLTALKVCEEIGDKNCIAISYGGIGKVYTKQKKYNDASKYLNKGLALSMEIGNLEAIKFSYDDLSTLDSAMGNYKKALQHYKFSIQYRDSLVNEVNAKQIVEQQMQYDFDKKETASKAEQEKKDVLAKAEIKRQTLIRNSTFGGVVIVGLFSFFLVRSVNRRRKTFFEKQVSQVEMKALRSQMNPHFIFNSLNSIHSFIQQNNGEKASDYLIKFSRLMRLILENSNHEEVPLESDLEALGLYMELEAARMNNKFTFSIDVDDEIDVENTMVPPLILQPFVENSIWHGMMHKEENGVIKINISKSGDMVKCTVEDNGVGREKAKELKSSTQKGKHESLGMKITNERIAIINRIKKSKAFVALKDLHDDAKKPLGTLVEVQLPLETGF